MARTSLAVQEQFNKLSGQKLSVSKISVPNTQIVNRAQINDLANDLGARFGVERIPTQRIYQIQNESGASGQPVFGVIGDTYDQIRFVGAVSNAIDARGQRAVLTTINDYVEITFYGTGLNILMGYEGTAIDARLSIDGGSEGVSNVFVTTSSNILTSRNYSANQIVSLVSGLSLGLHTIKLRNNNASNLFSIFGFEILNESSTMNIRPGSLLKDGRKFNLVSADSESFNTGFESGTLGTRGGRVLTYLKADGTVGKAVNPAGASAAFLASADHSNEEVIRRYNFREFGANRADDFSTLTGASARAFTLDDGTTTLVASSASASNSVSVGSTEYMSLGGVSAFFTITFVGTGLDINLIGQTTGSSDSCSVIIDGAASSGNIATTLNSINTVKICSGLPYGTHTVRITRLTATGFFGCNDFIVYGPKKPALPVGAAEIGEYYVMADFSPRTSAVQGFVANGILRKQSGREFIYVGTWGINTPVPTSESGDVVSGSTSGNYIEYRFYGTGFEWRNHIVTNAQSINLTFSVNGSANLSAFTTETVMTATNTFTAATGVFTATGNGAPGIVRVRNMPLGFYTLRITSNNTSTIYTDCLDIITPVHMPKLNELALQNTLPIGSCALGDLREVLEIDETRAKVSIATGVTSGPSTTSTVFIPCPEMSVTYYSEGEWVALEFINYVRCTVSGDSTFMAIYVNGVRESVESITTVTANYLTPTTILHKMYLPKGTHKIDGYWRTSNSSNSYTTSRQLMVSKIGK